LISASFGAGFLSSNAAAAMTMPGVQKPHWIACSATIACCTGCDRSRLNPSIVVIRRPSASPIVIRQLRSASPSTWTMQAPQSPSPQPYLVPVRFAASRSAQSSGVSGSMWKRTGRPLTVMLVMVRQY
jgi:hypothetical protein